MLDSLALANIRIQTHTHRLASELAAKFLGCFQFLVHVECPLFARELTFEMENNNLF